MLWDGIEIHSHLYSTEFNIMKLEIRNLFVIEFDDGRFRGWI